MIEVDVFWSFAFGASFAAFAQHELAPFGSSRTPDWSLSQSFRDTLLFLSVLFAPSGIYLLWAFPGWESMFVLTEGKEGIPAWLPTLFSTTNILLGVLGYYITKLKIQSQSAKKVLDMSHHNPWIDAYSMFTYILGLGYYRFTYAGTWRDWKQSTNYAITDFVFSPVFNTLLAMGVVFLPTIFWITVKHGAKSVDLVSKLSKKPALAVVDAISGHVVKRACIDYLVGSIAWVVYMFTVYSESDRAYFSHGPVGFYAPLCGFTFAHVFVFSLLLLNVSILKYAVGSHKKIE
ncbi:hypothetical protein HDV03_003475 [Kappamyces sp. JEL0829]|nr:hypothetical protein HDV03_003475 [Kappamyces sp. JEL0829]